MSLDPYAAEWEARGFPPDEPSSRCAEAREWLELARASFEAGEPTQTCYRSRVAAWLSTQLPDEVGPEASHLAEESRALDEAARRTSPEKIAAWEAGWAPWVAPAAADHLLHLRMALQQLREAPLEGLASVPERSRRRRAAWLLGPGMRELVERHAVAIERFFTPDHEAARAALRATLEERLRSTTREDQAWRAHPTWEESTPRKPQVDLRKPAGPPSSPRPIDSGPLTPFEADLGWCCHGLERALEVLESDGHDALRGFDACSHAKYRAVQLRAFPNATEQQLQRAEAAERTVEAWLALQATRGGPTQAEWAALRTRMFAAQVEAQIAGLERFTVEVRSLGPMEVIRRRRLLEVALSRKEMSLSGPMPPVVFETARYAEAEAGLRAAWAERVSAGVPPGLHRRLPRL